MQRIYFDHNATTNTLPEAQEVINMTIDQALNPSSIHQEGRNASHILHEARQNICQLLHLDFTKHDHNVIFTGSGTEANNMFFASHRNSTVIISAIEHKSVIEAAKHFCPNLHILDVDQDGIINLNQLEELLKTHSNCLISIMLANNETGVIQPIDQISDLAKENNAMLHSDCSQVLGKMIFDAKDLDYITLSAHKCGGISGTGALIHKTTSPISPLLFGGGQEKNMRPGTENIVGIAAFGTAAKWCHNNTKYRAEYLQNLQANLEAKLLDTKLGATIFGIKSPYGRLCNTTMVEMPNVPAQQQLIQFDLAGFAVSSGSACSSGKVGKSHVLDAMGVPNTASQCAIRISLSHTNTLDEVKKFTELWKNIALNHNK